MRADVLLLESGHAATRSQAQRLIASGVQWRLSPGVPWQKVSKNGAQIPSGAELHLQGGAETRYLSRAGLKLEGALRAVGLSVAARRCLDVGQGTGGFTDCLLQQGAAQVVGVDVGHGQLHPQLRADARVLCVEGLNARALTARSLQQACVPTLPEPPAFGLVTGDLSFISLTLVLPALVPLLAADGDLLMLVKPQFELQPGQLGKGGIVRDDALYAPVQQRIRDCCAALALVLLAWIDSPIRGGDGNREFFIHARKAVA